MLEIDKIYISQKACANRNIVNYAFCMAKLTKKIDKSWIWLIFAVI